MEPSHDPYILMAASIERMASAYRLLDKPKQGAADLPMAAYCAGLSLETILQALAHLDDVKHDARHDLRSWLSKCSPTLCDTVTKEVFVQWSFVCTVWTNRLRYYSYEAWIGHARATKEWKSLKKGDRDDKIRRFTMRFVETTTAIHNKGLAEWFRKQR